jgi:ComF family protein
MLQYCWHTLREYLKYFFHLLYPHICLHCGTEKLTDKQVLCSSCIIKLPYTDFFSMQENAVEKIFWGRTKIAAAGALLFFTKDSIVQVLIFELKYKQHKKAGLLLGNLIGMELSKLKKFNTIDFLIPIPISAKKARSRSFNQAQIICEGILQLWPGKKIVNNLKKIKTGRTQTQKDRIQRGMTNLPVFYLQQPEALYNKNLLLVDDIITTGATIESACICLETANPNTISLATAAYTIN